MTVVRFRSQRLISVSTQCFQREIIARNSLEVICVFFYSISLSLSIWARKKSISFSLQKPSERVSRWLNPSSMVILRLFEDDRRWWMRKDPTMLHYRCWAHWAADWWWRFSIYLSLRTAARWGFETPERGNHIVMLVYVSISSGDAAGKCRLKKLTARSPIYSSHVQKALWREDETRRAMMLIMMFMRRQQTIFFSCFLISL